MSEAEHIKEIKDLLKKAPFWKYATLATVLIEQEYSVYEVLAKDSFYDMTKFLKKVVNRFWQSVPTGYSIDDSFLLAIEESIFEPRDEWEKLALQIVKDIKHTFYAIWEKDTRAALKNIEKQIALITRYAELAGIDEKAKQSLVNCCLANQKKLVEEIVSILNKDKKVFVAELKDRKKEQLIDLDNLSKIHVAPGEKPAKKKLPEIRNSSVDYDMAAKKCTDKWLLNSTPEQWVSKVWEEYGTHGAFYDYYMEKKLPELCEIMSGLYYTYAQEDYIENKIPERVLGFWYLEAYSILCMYELVEKGYIVPENSGVRHEMEWFADSNIASGMLCAYAAGTEEIIDRLYRFSTGVHKEHPYTEAQDYKEIFAGKNSEELIHRVEQWESSDFKNMILCILNNDAKEFRKALLHSIRHERKMYDMSSSFFGPWSYACVKIAKKYGIEVEPVKVVELLDWQFPQEPIDTTKWRLPLQDEIDEWLNK